jgi:hypothetical protein
MANKKQVHILMVFVSFAVEPRVSPADNASPTVFYLKWAG